MKFRIIAVLAIMLLIFDASAKVRKTKKAQQETTEQQNTPSQITIKGKVQFTYKGYWNYPQPAPEFKMTVYQQQGTSRKIFAEADIDDNNEYTLTLPIETPGVYTVDCGKWQSVRIWGEDEDLTINFRGYDTARVKIKNPPYVYIQGGPKNELMNQVNFCNYRSYQAMIAISRALYNAKPDAEMRKVLSDALFSYNSDDVAARMRYLAEHNATTTSVLAVLPELNQESDKALIDQILAQLEAAHTGYAPIQAYKDRVAMKRLSANVSTTAILRPTYLSPNRWQRALTLRPER